MIRLLGSGEIDILNVRRGPKIAFLCQGLHVKKRLQNTGLTIHATVFNKLIIRSYANLLI